MNKQSNKRYSRQRECIMQFLAGSKQHPTANAVYDAVREKIPNISLGTVYRNLANLVEDGDVIKIDVGDGNEHYDGCNEAHYHMVCNSCRCVSDLEVEYDKKVDAAAGKACGGRVDYHSIVFIGICGDCIKKENQ